MAHYCHLTTQCTAAPLQTSPSMSWGGRVACPLSLTPMGRTQPTRRSGWTTSPAILKRSCGCCGTCVRSCATWCCASGARLWWTRLTNSTHSCLQDCPPQTMPRRHRKTTHSRTATNSCRRLCITSWRRSLRSSRATSTTCCWRRSVWREVFFHPPAAHCNTVARYSVHLCCTTCPLSKHANVLSRVYVSFA